MALIKYYAIDGDLRVKEYTTLESAMSLNPDWIFKEEFNIVVNGTYKNPEYKYTTYNGSTGETTKIITRGKWQIINLICHSNYYHEKIVINCDAVDPTGRVFTFEIKDTRFNGILFVLNKLRKYSKFESYENYKLSLTNSKLKKRIKELEELLNKIEE